MGGFRTAVLFPPLVFTGFGNYYPSLSVLAGAMQDRGLCCEQIDLNQHLFDQLLHKTHLSSIVEGFQSAAEGACGEGELNELCAEYLAAKAILRYRLFYDERGKALRAGSFNAPLSLLASISQRCYFERSVPELNAVPRLATISQLQRVLDILGPVLSEFARNVDLAGISIAMGPQLAPALAIAEFLNDQGVRIALGGPVITLMADADRKSMLIARPYIASATRYSGEDELIDLASSISKSKFHAATLVSEAETSNKWHGVPFRKRRRNQQYSKTVLQGLSNPVLSVPVTLGCYWGRCKYCDYVELYPMSGPRYIGLDVVSIVDEMATLSVELDIREFVFITEALPPGLAARIANSIIARGLSVTWSSFAMIDPGFDRSKLRLLKDSGCTSLCVGVETLCDRVLGLVEKRATRAMSIRFFQDCQDVGIGLVINLIPNLPTMTFGEAMETLDIVKDYTDAFDTINVFPFEATRSSRIGRDPGAFGLKVIAPDAKNGLCQSEYASNHLPIEDPAMSTHELNQVLAAYRSVSAKNVSPEFAGEEANYRLRPSSLLEKVPYDASASPFMYYDMVNGALVELPEAWSGFASQLAGGNACSALSLAVNSARREGENTMEESRIVASMFLKKMLQLGAVERC